MKRKSIALFLSLVLMFGCIVGALPLSAFASGAPGELVAASDIPLRLYYDEEASHGVAQGYDDVDTSFGSGGSLIEQHPNDDWERWSIPLGNGYFGANVFGRTETERIQLTEKTLANPYRITDGSANTDGLNNFSETYIDFGHNSSGVSGYSRELDLKTAISSVKYTYGGVEYSREYFTSYPDKAVVIKLDASVSGALSFTLRPTVPYEQEYMNAPGDRGGKTGTVTSSVSDGVGSIVLSGKLEYYDIDFVGLYTVYTDGGNVAATTCTNKDGDTDGTITVTGADSAYIVINMGTDYELCSETFTAATTSKPTFSTDLDDAMAKVEGYKAELTSVISGKSFSDAYSTLRSRHVNDYSELFGRVSLDIGCKESDFALTTDALLENYKNGSGSTYLEVLYFQYGRYLLIASSRAGALPANLQGTWNRYNHAPWSSGYWHNVNVQMNYWPAFSTNLSETFEAYVDYNKAYMPQAEQGATSKVAAYNPSVLGQDGGNGWSIATGAYPYVVYGDTSIGNLGFTTQLFWEYYAYSGDEQLLRDVVYPVLVSAARFITKMVREDANGNYIAVYTDSPEQYVNGVWYYTDKGTAYAQSFAYQNNYNTLLAARELGISFDDESGEDYAILNTVMEQLDKYSPVVVGLSGQVKEFFEEEYYGDMGEHTHRHISQLVGLYPGNIINGTTPAWIDAAKYTLTERGDEATGWGVAHRLNLWARVQDGERAHDLLEQLLSVNTATNLWDLHPPFQIDGNLGGTAGISEMLLQSHAGYIEPLAAVPASWTEGSYTGLVARGNFEVSAEWENGVATLINVKALDNCDSTVSLKYAGAKNAVVVDSNGRAVSFTETAKDVITFDTAKGVTYSITNFTKGTKPEAVEGLSLDGEFLSSSTISWDASADAAYYNVYVARNSDADYTLLTSTVATEYTYTPEALANDRLTFAVTAVGVNGTESSRALVYRNPDDVSAPIDGLSANVVNGELQVAVKTNDYAGKYKLWSRNNAVSAWELVCESTYPIIKHQGYDSSLSYGVSTVSLYGEETEVILITSYNKALESVDYKASNILLGQSFVPTAVAQGDIHAAAYGYQTLTDGSMDNTTGRFSTKTKDGMVVDATVSLKTGFLLGELRIFDFSAYWSTCNNAGSALTVEVMYEGEWTTVVDCKTNAEILAKRAKTPDGVNYLSFDLSGVKAQQIRIYIPAPVSGNSTSLYEIECSGVVIPGGKNYSDNLLLDKGFALTEATKKPVNSASGDASVLTDGILKLAEANNATAESNAKTWYTWYNQTDMVFDGTVNFGGEAILGKLRLYDYRGTASSAASVGPQIVVEVYRDGEWVQLLDVDVTANLSEYRKTGTRPNTASGITEYWIELDLDGAKAEGLRIYMPPRSTGNFGMYEIELDGYISSGKGLEFSANVFAGQEFIPTEAASKVVWSPHTYDKLTDGLSTNTNRFTSSGTSSFVDATLTFSGYEAYLDTLSIDYGTGWQQVRSGTGLVIQTFADGVWTDAVNLTYDKAYTGVHSFELGHVKASAVRLYVPAVYPNADGTLLAGDCIAIMEISCSGSIAKVDKTWSDNVLDGYVFEAGPDAGAIWSPNTYDKITDGVKGDSNRFSTSGGAAADGILDFGGKTFELHTMKVDFNPYNANRCGADFTVQVWRDGQWHDVLSHQHTVGVKYEEFSLGGVVAEKLRFKVSGKMAEGDCTQIYEMTCTGYEIPAEETFEDKSSNVLLGLEASNATVVGATLHPSVNDLGTIFDGNTGSTRYAVLDQANPYQLIIDLGQIKPLHTLSIYDWRGGETITRSNKTDVEVYCDGVWIPIIIDQPLVTTDTHTDFNLMGTPASKIRITFENTQGNNKSATIYEVMCTTGIVDSVDRSELLSAYETLDKYDTADSLAASAMKQDAAKRLVKYLMDVEAEQEDVDAYTAEIAQYVANVLGGNPVTDAYGDVASYNVGLEGDFKFKFYYELNADVLTDFADAYVLVRRADGTLIRSYLKDMTVDSQGRYVIIVPLAAAEMTEAVDMVLVLDDSHCAKELSRSIKDYTESAIEKLGSTEPQLVSMLEAMLNYGGYAQEYFGINTDNMANEGLYTEENDPVLGNVSATADTVVKTGNVTGIVGMTWTLLLESTVEAKMYFYLDEGVNINDYTFTLTTPSGTVDVTPVKYSDRYLVRIENIKAAELDWSYELVIYNEKDGSSASVTLSAMCYVNSVLNGTGKDTALVNLAKAIKLYNEAADAYFTAR